MEHMTKTADGEVIYNAAAFKTPHNHDTHAEAMRTALYCTDESKAQQHLAAETDINNIVDKFLRTGELKQIPVPPSYEAFGEIFDFQSAMNAIKAATDSFNALPANVRNRFNNDPATFVAYVDHALENGDIDPLREMGLAVPKLAATLPAGGTPGDDTPASPNPPNGP